jgi:ElaB/YqjD/DUF883 family membrane-anchored ribosome-binding protein
LHTPEQEQRSTTAEQGAELERLVDQLVESYEELVSLADERLDGIRSSDAARMARCIERENVIVQRVATLERERERIVGTMAAALGSKSGSATRITWIARRIEGAIGERIDAKCAHLRGLGERLASKNSVARSAAEHLAQHMTGLLQAVRRHLNHAQTYSRAGAVDAGARVVSSLDIRS